MSSDRRGGLSVVVASGGLCPGCHVLGLRDGKEEAVERRADLADVVDRLHGDELVVAVAGAQLGKLVEDVGGALAEAVGELLLGERVLGAGRAVDEEDGDLLVQLGQRELLERLGRHGHGLRGHVDEDVVQVRVAVERVQVGEAGHEDAGVAQVVELGGRARDERPRELRVPAVRAV